MIFCDNIKVKDGSKKYVPFKNCGAFWEGCGEDNVKTPEKDTKGHMDPVLRLYHLCCVMLPSNMDVDSRHANGTQALVQKVFEAWRDTRHIMLGGTVPINAILARQVAHIELKHCNDQVEPQVFSIKPIKYSFTGKVLKLRALQTKQDEQESLKMKAWQVPLW